MLKLRKKVIVMLKKHPALCVFMAIFAAIPHIYGEYRRTVLGMFDAVYWAIAALLIISAYCLYQLIYPLYSESASSKKKSDPFTVKCNAASFAVLIVAIYCFIVSGAIQMFFPAVSA